VTRGRVLTVLDTDARETLWTAPVRARPAHLEWSADGSRLLTVVPLSRGRFALTVHDENGRRLQSVPVPGTFSDAALAPNSNRVAVVRSRGTPVRSELLIVDSEGVPRQERVFAGKGRFSDVAWSPGGRWLLLGWESAGQWLFIRSTDVEKVKAVSSLSKQFDPGGTGAGAFPRIEGWCCPR
jgi:hypothetical protein